MKRMGKVAKDRPFEKNKKEKEKKRKVVPLCSKSFMLMELEIKRSLVLVLKDGAFVYYDEISYFKIPFFFFL
jgi:hypothetical protein